MREWDYKKLLSIVMIGIIAYFAIWNMPGIWNVLMKGLGMGAPFIIGGVIAFIVNVPMAFIENKLLVGLGSEKAQKLKRPIALILALVLVIGLFVGFMAVVIPQLVESGTLLIKKMPEFMAGLEKLLEGLPPIQKEYLKYKSSIESFDFNQLGTYLSNFVASSDKSVFSKIFGQASSILGGFVNSLLGLFFALYILGSKERLASQGTRVIYAYLPEGASDRIMHVLRVTNSNFRNFLTGQMTEAVILGTLTGVGMAVLQLPYALMIGVLTGFMAMIPVFGALIGAGVGAVLIFTVDPFKALVFLIFMVILQQIEGNLIYPKIMGQSLGLPPMWTLVAITLGTSLMGIVGMILFVPLTSVIYSLVKESTHVRLAARNIDVSEK